LPRSLGAPALHHPPLGPAVWSPPLERLRAAGEVLRGVARPHRAARRGAGLPAHRPPAAADALRHARGAVERLHPHRPPQGAARAGSALASRRAQWAQHHRGRARPRHRLSHGKHRDRGGDLRVSRARPAHGVLRRQPRHPARAGHGAGHRRRLRGGQPVRRSRPGRFESARGPAMSDLAAASAAPLPRVNLYLACGAALTAFALAVALLGLVYSPYAPSQVDLLRRLAPPSPTHLLGTDRFGRDVLSRVLAGGWRSITLGFGATALGLAIGLPIALLTGFYRGRLDQIVMRFVDALLSIPTLVFALLVIVGLGPGLVQAVLALGVAASPPFVRLPRCAVPDPAPPAYVTAARARGESALYIQYGEI